ncbi:MAG: L-glyceraldehyde 3-phosphate reductase [Bacteroidia bacterium]|nr:L-glyceraldehyde 3-phosphate reductase [Bacteroidia bacterium]
MAYTAAENRYQVLSTRRSGRSGLILPVVSLGLWHNFGDVDRLDTMRAMLRRAFDRGVFHFDLANNYGPPPGSAEENFGKIFRQDFLPYRDELILSTKAGYLMWPGPFGEWGSRKYLIASLDQSLKRMGVEYVDIFYSHRPDPHTPLEETMSALDHAVRSGKALYAGISSYSAEDTRRAAAILRQLGTPCVIHQPRYNMFDRWIETEGLVSALGETEMGCIVFSPLAQGMLTDRYLTGIPADSRAAKPHGYLKSDEISPARLQQIQALHQLAQTRGQSLAQMALAWTLRLPEVTSTLIGASSVAQLDNNLDAVQHLDFSASELEAIEAVLRG